MTSTLTNAQEKHARDGRARKSGTAESRRTRRSPSTPVERALEGRPLRSVVSWSHTVVLDGELNHRTAHALELELERLHDGGVTDITLDLSRLETIDRVGVAVIAFRCQLSTRRGFGFQLIAGSERVQRAFRAAGVAETLPFVAPDAEAELGLDEQEVSG